VAGMAEEAWLVYYKAKHFSQQCGLRRHKAIACAVFTFIAYAKLP
jgi:hypothetical protein